MRTPGFVAEMSLHKMVRHYRLNEVGVSTAQVMPQQFGEQTGDMFGYHNLACQINYGQCLSTCRHFLSACLQQGGGQGCYAENADCFASCRDDLDACWIS